MHRRAEELVAENRGHRQVCRYWFSQRGSTISNNAKSGARSVPTRNRANGKVRPQRDDRGNREELTVTEFNGVRLSIIRENGTYIIKRVVERAMTPTQYTIGERTAEEIIKLPPEKQFTRLERIAMKASLGLC